MSRFTKYIKAEPHKSHGNLVMSEPQVEESIELGNQDTKSEAFKF